MLKSMVVRGVLEACDRHLRGLQETSGPRTVVGGRAEREQAHEPRRATEWHDVGRRGHGDWAAPDTTAATPARAAWRVAATAGANLTTRGKGVVRSIAQHKPRRVEAWPAMRAFYWANGGIARQPPVWPALRPV